jgi:hypothetical protein
VRHAAPSSAAADFGDAALAFGVSALVAGAITYLVFGPQSGTVTETNNQISSTSSS